jgi:hypothetical protein
VDKFGRLIPVAEDGVEGPSDGNGCREVNAGREERVEGGYACEDNAFGRRRE